MDHLGHAEDGLVEPHPLVHPAQLHVAHHVVDADQQGARRGLCESPPRESRQERAVVSVALNEGVDHVPIGGNAGQLGAAVLVLDPARAVMCPRTARDRLLVGAAGIRHAEGDGAHAVAVPAMEAADGAVTPQRAGHDEPDPALLEDVRDPVAGAGLQSRIGHLRESQGVLEEERGVGGIAHVELEMVDAADRHRVGERRLLSAPSGLRRHHPSITASGTDRYSRKKRAQTWR
jgi:hypothetical protein